MADEPDFYEKVSDRWLINIPPNVRKKLDIKKGDWVYLKVVKVEKG